MMTKGEKAKALFMSGCNCSQAVAAAFCEETGLSEELTKKLTMGFGGGMGRMREVCGAISAMTFVISAIYSEDKANIYNRVQTVANKFREENGSIVCRELLGLSIKGADSPVPEKRTNEYYKKRPCPELVAMAADILDEYLKNNPE
ncbi:MAG: C-GCAxxG-C-C family protein [Eubacterium sp.]|nr:C-GCAxxG-C-C family protein [Eubacterium sp.]